MKKTKNILVVDPSPVYCAGLQAVLCDQPDLEIVASAQTQAEAMAITDSHTIDMAIIEINLHGGIAFDLVRMLRQSDSTIAILVLSSLEESVFAERTLKIGANGFVMKDSPIKGIIEAIRRVADQEIALSERQTATILSRLLNQPNHTTPESPVSGLSNRELEVFREMGNGRTNREIASSLNISIKTVESHQAHIRRKLGATTRHELMHMSFSWLHTSPGNETTSVERAD